MNRWGLVGAGLGTYVLALMVTAPATFADAALQRASEGRLRLAEAHGTLWSGAGRLEIRAAGGRMGIGRNFSWRVEVRSLLRGHLVCQISSHHALGPFPLTLAMSGVELSNADISLPAAVLGMGVEKLAPLGLTGEVRIHAESLSISRNAVLGAATLQWLAAGSALTTVSPLGDYEMRLDGENRTVNAVLRTITGPIQLDGKGSWTQGARPLFSGTAGVPQAHQQQLAPLLRLIAIERSAGSFEFRLD